MLTLEHLTAAHWPIHSDWTDVLREEFDQPYFRSLLEFVAAERATRDIYPAPENVFAAFATTAFKDTRVVILGQDPYHGPGQAHGLSFSVSSACPLPPSLKNIFKELASDLCCLPPASGDLNRWARQGVLLLNTVLTVRAGQAHSHQRQGWETLTDRVIEKLGQRRQPLAFVLWGKPAGKKASLIKNQAHFILESPHPSPLSASRGFLGSRPFSRVNDFLEQHDQVPVSWSD